MIKGFAAVDLHDFSKCPRPVATLTGDIPDLWHLILCISQIREVKINLFAASLVAPMFSF